MMRRTYASTGRKVPGRSQSGGNRLREQAPADWIARLRGRVATTAGGCWIVGEDPDSYHGSLVGGRRDQLHRLVFELLVEPIEPGNHVHHECETPACINPAHLVQLTPSDHAARHAEMRRR